MELCEINKLYCNVDLKSERSAKPPQAVSQAFIDRVVDVLRVNNKMTISNVVRRTKMSRNMAVRVVNHLESIGSVTIQGEKRSKGRSVIFNSYTKTKEAIEKEEAAKKRQQLRDAQQLKRDKIAETKKEIADKYNKGGVTLKRLGYEYGYSEAGICKIVSVLKGNHQNQHAKYLAWEEDVIKAVDGKGIDAYKLSEFLGRDIVSIHNKASSMNVSLKGLKKDKEKRINKKPRACGKVFDVIKSLGVAIVPLIIKETGFTDPVIRNCLRYLVENNIIKYKKSTTDNGFTTYVYYI